MYLEQNFVDPATLDLQAHRKMRNRLLRHWPTKLVNDVEVMDKLYLYDGSVLDTPSHRKIYNILGVKIEELKSQEWKGIDNYYIYFNVVQGTYDNVSNTQLDTQIQFLAPFTEKSAPEVPEFDRSEWFEAELSYEPLQVDALSNVLSDSEIISRIVANPYIVEYSIEDEPLITALALLDVDEVIFERVLKVTYRGLTSKTFTSQTSKDNSGTILKEVNLQFMFRRKPMTTQLAYDAYLDSVILAMYGSVNQLYGSVYLQLLSVYHSMVDIIDDAIIYVETYIDEETGEPATGASYYRKDGLLATKSREFNKTITARLKTGYKKKKVSMLKKVITVVVVVVIIVVAVMSGQPQLGAKGAAAAFAWGKATLVLTIGSLAMISVSVIIAKRDPAWAAYIGKMSTVLGYLATAAGITGLVQNMAKGAAASNLTKKAAEELAKEGVVDASKDAIKQKALEMAGQLSFKEALNNITFDGMQDMLVDFVKAAWSKTTSFNMQSMLDNATKGFQLYTKYINPPADGLDELSRQVKEQEKQLDDTSSAGLKDKIDYTFSSPYYSVYDFNGIMQAVPHRMTQGLVDDTFNKYYDGVTSKVKYRGYLG